jgi:hypothetical protein
MAPYAHVETKKTVKDVPGGSSLRGKFKDRNMLNGSICATQTNEA